jgi:hypothetical protein
VFIQQFDTLRAQYRQKIVTSSAPAFWLAEAEGKVFGVLHGE